MPPLPGHLDERYPGRSHRRVKPGLVVVAALLAVLLVVAVGAGVRLASTPLRFGLVAYERQSEAVMSATIEVVRPAGSAVTCRLSAIDEQFRVAGERSVTLQDPDPPRSRLKVEIATLGPAVAVRLDGCSLDP